MIPSYVDPEFCALGAMIMDRDSRQLGLSLLSSSHFQPKLAPVFEAIKELEDKGSPVDIVSLMAQVGKPDDRDAAAFLSEIIHSTSTSQNIEHHSMLLVERENMRALKSAVKENLNIDDPSLMVAGLQRAVDDQIKNTPGGETASIQDLLGESMDKFDKGKPANVVRTGFYDIDRLLVGLELETLTILAARPGLGKTSLGLNIARNASTEGNKVLFISIEMSRAELVDRLLCSVAEVSLHLARSGIIQKDTYRKLADAGNSMYNMPLVIADKPGAQLSDIERIVGQEAARTPALRLVVVDYIQLVNAMDKGMSREQEVSLISRTLKKIARRYGVAVLALSQLSRASEKREDSKPRLSDLRDSGAIEQDADVVLFLSKQNQVSSVIDVHCAKNRNGPTGSLSLEFRAEFTKFVDKEI